MKFLITAGPTREYIDPIRFISNASSGKMGYAIAEAAKDRGHDVTLISTVEIQPAVGVDFIGVDSADEMFKAVKRVFGESDCLIMAAAVADYTPVRTYQTKLKKSDEKLSIELKPTADILKWAGERKSEKQLLVGFALEDRNMRENAVAKMEEKNLDVIIANRPSAIGAEKATFHMLVRSSEWSVMEDVSKVDLSKRIIEVVEGM